MKAIVSYLTQLMIALGARNDKLSHITKDVQQVHKIISFLTRLKIAVDTRHDKLSNAT